MHSGSTRFQTPRRERLECIPLAMGSGKMQSKRASESGPKLAKCILHRAPIEHKSAWFDDRLANTGNESDATHSLWKTTALSKGDVQGKSHWLTIVVHGAGLTQSKPKCLLFTSRSDSSQHRQSPGCWRDSRPAVPSAQNGPVDATDYSRRDCQRHCQTKSQKSSRAWHYLQLHPIGTTEMCDPLHYVVIQPYGEAAILPSTLEARYYFHD